VQLALASVISGQVITTQARWTDDQQRIVTDAVVETDTGDRVTVSELGGMLDGIGQISMPGPMLLEPGMRVDVDAHDAATLAGAHMLVVDDANLVRIADSGAFVREGPTPSFNYLFWPNGCIFMSYDAAGTTELAGDTEFPIMDGAMATWNTGIATCGYMKMMSAGKVTGHEVGKDYINLVKFREDKWCIPASGSDPERCHNAAAAGITTVTFVKHPGNSDDGAILDADVEINGVNFAISSNGQSLGSGCHADLANTITHEFGHVLGLEHTCVTSADPPRTDGAGNPVPTCPTTDPVITEATMFPYQVCDETKKSSLSDDDIAGACSIYPESKDPGTCAPATDPGGCCSAGGGDAASSLALLVLALLWTGGPRVVQAARRRSRS
jgi:hypothetical protein